MEIEPELRKRPAVGVGVFVLREGKILFGKRLNAHGAGTWSLPGGHLEWHESIEACARREVLEETGLEIQDVTSLTFTNDIFVDEDKHYITLFVKATVEKGDPVIREPMKCAAWEWFSPDRLPQPLFLPMKNLIQQGFRV